MPKSQTSEAYDKYNRREAYPKNVYFESGSRSFVKRCFKCYPPCSNEKLVISKYLE